MMCMRIVEIGRIFFYKILWWKVDFGGLRNIYSINIMFKNYNGLGDYEIIYKYWVFFVDC